MSKKPGKATLADTLDTALRDQLLALKESLAPAPQPEPVAQRTVQKPKTRQKPAEQTPKIPSRKQRMRKAAGTLIEMCHTGEQKIFIKVRSTTDLSRSSLSSVPTKEKDEPARKRKASEERVARVVHLAQQTSQQKQKAPTMLVQISMEKHSAHLVDGSLGEVKLKVHRGAILKSEGHCSRCHTAAAPLTRYADSNYGPVVLCTVCKIRAFEFTFGHADAMPLKVDHAHAHKGKW